MKKLLLGYGAEIIHMGKKQYPFLEVDKINAMMWSGYQAEGVKVCERYHETAMQEIFNKLEDGCDMKIIQIAGPSSSGKTTLAQNIFLHLCENDYNPVMISLDDYYRGKEYYSVNEFGESDYESPEAIDIALFNEQIYQLTHGITVELPLFNFEKVQREAVGRLIRAGECKAIIVEGIHALNPVIAENCNDISRFKIFVNAMGQITRKGELLFDAPDLRLVRRMVRDHFHRCTDALETLKRWPSVREGEEEHIFPYADSADISFNTWLPYETCVLKTFTDDILKEHRNYGKFAPEAKRLKHILSYFSPVSPEIIPTTSILKEFVK
ncbi:MAG: nucleoside kinase [Clostridia bacterium]